ncbi:hypothetical protein E2C01_038070 [Portunus trituberculatus]|uniref:Uncharacterized protein n=1 Tax=Portunus trituberculatus TaxID=210409 RepID=A0A5B7FFU0_PORTR|nr:hypothetical protein [Portunus trituberculatus]
MCSFHIVASEYKGTSASSLLLELELTGCHPQSHALVLTEPAPPWMTGILCGQSLQPLQIDVKLKRLKQIKIWNAASLTAAEFDSQLQPPIHNSQGNRHLLKW